eukprot:15463942-Alexandrium_andersonii.AAC.1
MAEGEGWGACRDAGDQRLCAGGLLRQGHGAAAGHALSLAHARSAHWRPNAGNGHGQHFLVLVVSMRLS